MEIFIDKAVNPEMETEIFVNANMTHYPLRDYANMWNTMSNVVKDYEKIGKRNKKKDDIHLNKHAMHLIRLFMMALDILEKGEINTYRTKEHGLLMDIRSGKYQKEVCFFRFRNSLGLHPLNFLKSLLKVAMLEKPDSIAISVIDRLSFERRLSVAFILLKFT